MIPPGVEEKWQEAKRAMGRGDFAGVREACDFVLEARPDHARAHNFAGLADIGLGHAESGLKHLRLSVELEPGNPALWLNLGAGHVNLEDPGEALRAFQAAHQLSPGPPSILGMANCLLGLGRWREARDLLRSLPEADPAAVDVRLHSMNYDSTVSPLEVYRAHASWGAQFPCLERPPLRDPRPERTLRVGFVSPDFRNHSCAYFLEALWRHRIPSEFQLIAYSEFPFEDDRTRLFQEQSDAWRSTHGRSDHGVADMVRSDAVDILIDLAGHTLGNRLGVFIQRPAPIQLTWLGYPGTTGLQVFDGRITDALADPPGSEPHATEPLLRLPHFLCYTPAAETPAPNPPPSAAGAAPTFGCFNAPAKLNDQVFDLWSRLLRQLPSARLLLKAKSLQHRSAQDYFLRAFADRGVAEDRIEFMGWMAEGRSHLSAYQRVDVALDPFPYNGTTTTCEALWMGVPVVTLRGDRHSGRVGESLLGAVGLQEWVADSEADYLRVAQDLASNPDQLATLRRDLRPRLLASPLLDGRAFAQSMQDLFRRLWMQAI